jgi:hypothetical protein
MAWRTVGFSKQLKDNENHWMALISCLLSDIQMTETNYFHPGPSLID